MIFIKKNKILFCNWRGLLPLNQILLQQEMVQSNQFVVVHHIFNALVLAYPWISINYKTYLILSNLVMTIRNQSC